MNHHSKSAFNFAERNQKIKELYLKNPIKEIAQQFGISRQRVFMIADSDGKLAAQNRSHLVSLPQKDLDEMFSLFPKVHRVYVDAASGMSIAEMFAKHKFPSKDAMISFMCEYRAKGVPFPIYGRRKHVLDDQAIIENGLKLIHRHKAIIERVSRNEHRDKKICEEYFAYANIDEIAKRYNVKSKQVSVIANCYKHKYKLNLSRDVARLNSMKMNPPK